MPQISVIVPVYKVEKYIHRCVDSILGQTFADFELILVDDGSPDNCGAICDEYAQKDSRVVVIHQENRGLSAARNTGIDWSFANSDSQWITFIDSDDWVHPQMLDQMMEAACFHAVKMCMCNFAEVDDNEDGLNNTTNRQSFCMDTETAYVTQHYSMTACGKLYFKDAFYKIRYPIEKLHEDVATTYKVLFQYPQIAVLSAPLYYYRKTEGSITRRVWNPNRLDEVRAIEEQILFFHRNGIRKAEIRMIGAYYWVLAKQLAQIRDVNGAVKYRLLVKQKLWCAIKRFRKKRPLSLKNDAFVLEQLFPVFMDLYWRYKAALKQLR